MSAAHIDQLLRVALLALLPKDGTPWSVASLAAVARCTPGEVRDALRSQPVSYLVDQDAYYLIKQGNAL